MTKGSLAVVNKAVRSGEKGDRTTSEVIISETKAATTTIAAIPKSKYPRYFCSHSFLLFYSDGATTHASEHTTSTATKTTRTEATGTTRTTTMIEVTREEEIMTIEKMR